MYIHISKVYVYIRIYIYIYILNITWICIYSCITYTEIYLNTYVCMYTYTFKKMCMFCVALLYICWYASINMIFSSSSHVGIDAVSVWE